MKRLITWVSEVLSREATARTFAGMCIGIAIAIVAAILMLIMDKSLEDFAKVITGAAIAVTILTIIVIRKGKW